MVVAGLRRLGASIPAVWRFPTCTAPTTRWVSSAASSCAEAETGNNRQQGWGQTKVADILKKKKGNAGAWLWCAKDDSVLDAIKKMAKGNVGSLLVFDPSKISLDKSPETSATAEAVVGIVTERDYLTKVAVKGKSSAELPVSEIMTPQSKLTTVSPQKSVLDVMTVMNERNFRHVPVVDGDVYLGMISIRDAVGVMVAEHKEEVDRIHEYIQGSY